MKRFDELKSTILKINNRSYKAYKNIKDTYRDEFFTLYIDHVQGDPFATPSRIRVRVSQKLSKFPEETFSSKSSIDKIKQLYTDLGISSILVMGGSGDYFEVAHRVICMTQYIPDENIKLYFFCCLLKPYITLY